jgi:prepilin-type N-terminal cleavage/methylation domain-containing protein
MTLRSYSKCLRHIATLPSGNNKGVTLLELLIVLMIIGILVTAAVKTWDVSLQRSRFNATVKEMEQLSWAIAGNPDLVTGGKRSDFGYIGDVGLFPPTLQDLNENISAFQAWHGPYIKAAFQESPKSYMADAWGDTYVYPNPMTLPDSGPVYLRSYGGGSVATPQNWLTRVITNRKADLLSNTVSGDFSDAYGNPPTTLDTMYVTLFYPVLGRPDSVGPLKLYSIYVRRFEFSHIPVGNHRLKVIGFHPDSTAKAETVEKYISVFPRLGATDINIRFSTLKFGGK